MKKYAYNIHDWTKGTTWKGARFGATTVGKVIIIAKKELDAKNKIKEYIGNLNDNERGDELYYGSPRYYYSKSNLKVIGIIDLEEENTYE